LFIAKGSVMSKKSAVPGAEVDDEFELNVAVVRGTCSSPADVRTLPSGDVLAQLQVSARVGEAVTSVPVAVVDPAAWVQELDAGDEIVVVGHVRRRFFRAAGATASRVEIQAELVARARDRRRMTAARRRVESLLAAIDA
jgi:single-strand DNA-binding protein